jgi:hypothetical protein
MNNNNIEKLVSLFDKRETVYKLSNKRIAERNNASLDEVYEAKRLFKAKMHSALLEHCKETGVDFNGVKSYWHKSKMFSMNVIPDKVNITDLKDALIEEMQDYSPVYPEIKREKIKDAHLLVIDPADIHIGKLASAFETGEEYDNQIAVKRVKEGVQGILNKTLGFNVDKILFIIGNDILHIDSPNRITTSGTPQDTDGMWYDNFLTAKQLYVEVIEMLLTIADVHVQYDPSNHDYINGFFLADSIKTWFRNSKNITFNTSIAHRKYFAYGKNLIGTTHGDGAKEADLPLLMAQESATNWAVCNHRYVYTHHIHHKKSKDYGSVCVESLRSPSGTDSWHHRNGYQHSPKAVEAFIHHPEQGQVARITHLF